MRDNELQIYVYSNYTQNYFVKLVKRVMRRLSDNLQDTWNYIYMKYKSV